MMELTNIINLIETLKSDGDFSAEDQAVVQDAVQEYVATVRKDDLKEDGFQAQDESRGFQQGDDSFESSASRSGGSAGVSSGASTNDLLRAAINNLPRVSRGEPRSSEAADAESARLYVMRKIEEWEIQKARWDTIEQKINLEEVSPKAGLSSSVK